ncbi:MAG: leucine-rich repeat domain-containing protein, partial [Paludibacteraceae bacterium]|nr:leucine-rich repeat domain-containing protein [Paludibacteraceae bacterium]
MIVLSIPFCKRWFSTVEYYFSDDRKQATSSLKYRLTGTKTVEVAGLERFWSGEVIIPEKTIYCGYLCTVTSIGKDAFYGCSRITSVKIPTSVTEIGWGAFYGCSGLTSVEIPSSVTEIGS